MSSYELGGGGILAEDFVGKNGNSLNEALEEKWRKNVLGIKLTMLEIQSL